MNRNPLLLFKFNGMAPLRLFILISIFGKIAIFALIKVQNNRRNGEIVYGKY